MPRLTIVCVHYGNSPSLEKEIAKITKGVNTNLMLVDTGDIDKFGEEINTFYEFSGYQKGLDNLFSSSNFPDSILFINDTIFSSHFTFLFKAYLKYLIRCDSLGYLNNHCIYGLYEFRYGYKIIPSCFFLLKTDALHAKEIRFHPFEKINDESKRNIYFGNEEIFDRHIDNWLYPKSFFRGWYKAIPGNHIDDKTYLRKRLAIYLEHSMLDRLSKAEIKSNVEIPKLFKVLKFIDRVYTNINKVLYRIKSLLKSYL